MNQSDPADMLIRRLRDRAADPSRSKDAGSTIFADRLQRLDLTSLLRQGLSTGNDLRRIVEANQQGVILPDLNAKTERLAHEMNTPAPSRLPAPATEAALNAAEATLGFRLPSLLRRLYGEVADGGFGPSNGLMPIAEMLEFRGELLNGDLVPRGREWPANLLPIVRETPIAFCLDVSTEEGPVVVWDAEGLDEYAGNAAWSRSFSEEAPSLHAWLEQWLVAPSPEEQLQATFGQIMASQVEEARRSRAMIAGMSPQERAAMGLPEVGWEQVVWGGLGWDPDEQSA